MQSSRITARSIFRAFWRAAPAIALIAVSFVCYRLAIHSFSYDGWQVDHFDHGDYRFLAEHFWGIPHDLESYDPVFNENWGAYLERMPFRDIGVGTFFLASKLVIGWVAPAAAQDPGAIAVLLPLFMQVLLAIAYLVLFLAVRRRFGLWPALLTLAIVLFPLKRWFLTEEMLSEPLLRVMFCFLLAAVLWVEAAPARLFRGTFLLFGLLLLCLHLKNQWLFAVPILACALLWVAWRQRSAKVAIATCILAALLPGSLILTHWIGWRNTALTPGSSLHVNYKNNGEFYRWACPQLLMRDRPFCTESEGFDGFWGLPLGDAVPVDDLQAADRMSIQYILLRPRRIISDFLFGLVAATNFPAGDSWDYAPIDRPLPLMLFDAAVWIVLIFGLTRRRTFLLSVVAIMFWIVPAVGVIVANYSVRYHRAMAGLPLVAAVLIIVDCCFFRVKRKTKTR